MSDTPVTNIPVKRRIERFCIRSALAAALLTQAVQPVWANDQPLPTFGGLGGGIISDQLEVEIGQQVLSSLRRSAPQIQDPLTADYAQTLVHRLLPSVPLNDKHLTLIMIDSPDLNAFAVPGNIVGVNGGLFLSSDSEQQFASVLAHELAHLSQRHFARRLEQQENTAPMALAGMIAGIVLSAVTKSDIGVAAIAGTQALSIQNMLQYSRAHEQEADRIGLQIMADADLDPRGMPAMFEQMMKQNRLQGSHVPEYLSTHPLTQSRVSDTRSRAEQYPSREVPDSLEYHLIRARMQAHYAETPSTGTEHFKRLQRHPDGARNPAVGYGLAVAYLSNDQPELAVAELQTLLNKHPGRITFQVTLAEALLRMEHRQDANTLMREALKRNPDNYPITEMLARTELDTGNTAAAVAALKKLTRQFPEREHLWLRLVEAEGQARNIVGVHQAQAEYELLMGDLSAARRQLLQAQERVAPGTPAHQAITERLNSVASALSRRQ
ncbi:M48 family metalloprotease [Marinobacter sp. SS21]|uniref:M48 family metalloprotease n=1 Tax=Marinobacter sp. SS21 TaxID=2979460 RepID=UPI00232C5955|nr:M48 family metalloprotease [Marinobacter sp. SS21]MDC0661976.1 M48 family metalloprotease [Marinobacter sp. SS21]